MDRFNRVIVAVDPGEASSGNGEPDDRTQLALARAAWLAGVAGAELRIVTVVYLTVTVEPPWRHTAEPNDRPVVKETLARLEALAAAPRAQGVKTSVEVRFGRVTEQLLESVKQWDADLVVVGGARREGALGLLGSTSTQVFRKAPCSVWIARQDVEHDFKEALAALTPDDRAHGVLRIASSFAGTVDARLHVVGAVEHASPERLASVQASLDEWTKPYASKVRFGAIEALPGEPGEVILERAARHDAEIVFIGPSRRSALASFLGSHPTGSTLKRLRCSLVCTRVR